MFIAVVLSFISAKRTFSLPQRTFHRNQQDSATWLQFTKPKVGRLSEQINLTNESGKNFLISFTISPHKENTARSHYSNLPPNATYIFSTLTLAAVSRQFLEHLRLAKWSLHYISYKHLRFVSPEYYPRTALCYCLASLASSLGWLVGN